MRRAEKLGLLATDDEVDRKLSEIKSPFTHEQFDARLKEKKITMDDFRREVRRSLTVEKVLNKEITSKISVSDQDITDYYNAHQLGIQLYRDAISSGAHMGDNHAESPGSQSEERQGTKRGRRPQEDSDAFQPARQRRRLRHCRHELLRRPGNLRQWRRPRIYP